MIGFTTCPICRGMGRYWSTIVTRPEVRVPTYRPVCDVCDGKGRVPSCGAIVERTVRLGLQQRLQQRREQ